MGLYFDPYMKVGTVRLCQFQEDRYQAERGRPWRPLYPVGKATGESSESRELEAVGVSTRPAETEG